MNECFIRVHSIFFVGKSIIGSIKAHWKRRTSWRQHFCLRFSQIRSEIRLTRIYEVKTSEGESRQKDAGTEGEYWLNQGVIWRVKKRVKSYQTSLTEFRRQMRSCIVLCSRCYFVQIHPSSQNFNSLPVRRTGGWSNGRIGGRTVTPSKRDARTHLNKSNGVRTIDAFSRIVLVLVLELSFNGIISNSWCYFV